MARVGDAHRFTATIADAYIEVTNEGITITAPRPWTISQDGWDELAGFVEGASESFRRRSLPRPPLRANYGHIERRD